MDNTNQVKLLNPLSLAYMGDAVLDQFVRKHIILKLRAKPNRLHQQAKRYVSAKSQAATLDQLNYEVILKLKIQMYKLTVRVLD